MRKFLGVLLISVGIVSAPLVPLTTALQGDTPVPTEVTPVLDITPTPGPLEELPPITDTIDENTLQVKVLLDQAAPFLMLLAFLLIAVLKWIFPNTEITTERIYLWVVGAATAIFTIILILGAGDNLMAFLLYIAEPSTLLLDFLKVLLGPAGLYTLARVVRAPFLGDTQGSKAFSTKRVPESPLISAVSASLSGPKG